MSILGGMKSRAVNLFSTWISSGSRFGGGDVGNYGSFNLKEPIEDFAL